MRSIVLLIALSSVACAPKRRDVQDMPRWKTEEGNIALRYELIEQFLANDANEEALTMIRQLRDKGEKDPTLDLYQGQALFQQGFNAEAERVLLAYREKRPRDPKALKTLALVYADSDRTETAIAALQEATSLDDQDAEAWNNLGFLLLSVKQRADALEALHTAVALDGTVPRYRNNLGFALAANGHYRDAFEAFQSVGSTDDAHYNVGVAYEHANELEPALRHYRKAVEYNPNHTAATEAVQRLESLADQAEDP